MLLLYKFSLDLTADWLVVRGHSVVPDVFQNTYFDYALYIIHDWSEGHFNI